MTTFNFLNNILNPECDVGDLTGKDSRKIHRMTFRPNQKQCLIYPESTNKNMWDLFMTIVLLVACIITPVQIAFYKNHTEFSTSEEVVEHVINFLFFIDIIVVFNSAFYNENSELVDNRKRIAFNYIKGWFVIDFLAVVPFDELFNQVNVNGIVRVARFGRLYKLVKLTRLVRIFKLLKVIKEKQNVMKQMNNFMQISVGFERLMFIMIIILLMNHISACLYVILASIWNEDYKGTWMEKLNGDSKEMYLISLYWSVATITTVGYGDISGTNNLERLFCSLVMIFGVFAFSMANGSVTSIIQNIDSKNAKME